jgi:Heterokaryon incompatibility protein (HET)
MRLLKRGPQDEISLTKDLVDGIPPYVILSHTWSANDDDEVTFDDLQNKRDDNKAGWAKLHFCGEQTKEDGGPEYFWVDTCCINKANHTEFSEAITSMFRWYQRAVKCYVYLSDVSADSDDSEHAQCRWEAAFRKSRWFTRGWTLQELLAPASVEFFSREGRRLGSKETLELLIHNITKIPVAALRGEPLSQFSFDERWQWAAGRETKKIEDKAYCLLGIFNISMSLRYGEEEKEFKRLKDKVDRCSSSKLPIHR